MPAQKLSNIQFELLKLYSTNIPDEDVANIKNLLANYFLEKAEKKIEEFSKEKK